MNENVQAVTAFTNRVEETVDIIGICKIRSHQNALRPFRLDPSSSLFRFGIVAHIVHEHDARAIVSKLQRDRAAYPPRASSDENVSPHSAPFNASSSLM